MDINELALLFISIVAVFGVGVVAYFISTYFMREHICKHSTFMPILCKLNSEYVNVFCEFDDTYKTTHYCNSKSQFDKTNFNRILHDFCTTNKDHLNYIIPLAYKNSYSFTEYKEKALNILDNKSYYNSKIMKSLEIRVFQEAMLSPPTTVNVTIHSRYVSPKGRNSYHNYYTFEMSSISSCLDNIERENSFEQEKRRQRARMSDSLRYDIMKRDGFKCVLCGASQKDGAKLHVDHIFPIAKGGKTEPSNLRTLCDRCNLGKKDKYDPNGFN